MRVIEFVIEFQYSFSPVSPVSVAQIVFRCAEGYPGLFCCLRYIFCPFIGIPEFLELARWHFGGGERTFGSAGLAFCRRPMQFPFLYSLFPKCSESATRLNVLL